jgi:hypothetical protein
VSATEGFWKGQNPLSRLSFESENADVWMALSLDVRTGTVLELITDSYKRHRQVDSQVSATAYKQDQNTRESFRQTLSTSNFQHGFVHGSVFGVVGAILFCHIFFWGQVRVEFVWGMVWVREVCGIVIGV